MDHEYELEDDYAPRILWGRLAFFAIALLLAFLFGRCTKDVGVPQAQYDEQVQQVIELSSENAILQQQLEAAGSGEGEETPTDGETGGNGGNGNNDGNAEESEAPPEDEGGEEVGEDGTTYVVQEGDTLTTIAQKFYGDPAKFDLIVDANNLDESTQLRVGQELIIPPDPDA